jgi:KDO2-lipid IV(A) lauroyltransferase
MMGGVRRIRHRCEYAALVTAGEAIGLLPWRLTRWLGRSLGSAFYLVDGPHRRLTVANLQAAFPARSPKECRALARATFQHFGRLAVDLLKFRTLSPDAMLGMVEVDPAGAERVEQAQAGGRGILFLTGHFGFWEIQALAHGLRFGPMSVMARALDNPHVHELLERIRVSTGNSVIYRRGALRRVFRTLGGNGAVGMLIDQHVQPRDAVYVDFFNRPAATTAALAVLAARTGAPVIPLFALPLDDGRYRLVYEPAVEPPENETPDALRAFTQRCTDVLEMYVRRYPDLWLWMHRRWRDRESELETTAGMFPAASPEPDAEPEAENVVGDARPSSVTDRD